jgi:PTS system nitrogen regulatory IIA component
MLDVVVSGKIELLEEIGQHLARLHDLSEAAVVRSLAHRGQVGSTALGQRVAIPHARIKGPDRARLAYFRLKRPIPYDAPDGKPVSDVIVILVPTLATEEHLRILALVSQLFSDPRFGKRLHGGASAMAVKQVFDAFAKSGL